MKNKINPIIRNLIVLVGISLGLWLEWLNYSFITSLIEKYGSTVSRWINDLDKVYIIIGVISLLIVAVFLGIAEMAISDKRKKKK